MQYFARNHFISTSKILEYILKMIKPSRKHIPKICKYCNNQSYTTPKKEKLNKIKNSVKINEKIINLKRIINNIKAYNRTKSSY